MRKRMLAITACIAMAVTMTMGCGEASSSGNATKKVVSDNASTTGDEDNAGKQKEETTNVSIKEQVLVEKKDITITATEYVTDSFWGDGIKVVIENNSKKDVTISCDALIVNDYMITDLFATEVAAGKKANETVYLSSYELDAAGIDVVGKIETYFSADDSDTYDTVFQNAYAQIETSEFDQMDETPNDVGTELYNKNGVRIVGKTVDEDSFWGTAILLYCENTTGKNIGISVDNMSINGYMMDPLFTTEVYAEKKAIDDITVFSSDLEDNGIESIETIELQFHIYNLDTYDTIADSDPITFSAE